MSTEQEQIQSNEELNKSIDALLDDVFADETPNNVEKAQSIDIAGDAQTTADAAVAQAPKGQMDYSRGAGRPAQISDVPQTDMDGRRDSTYDASTTERENVEDENEEANKQATSVDQTTTGRGRMTQSPMAPPIRPFKKSEDGTEITEVTKAEFEEYQAFKKAQADADTKAEELEVLRKAEVVKKDQEELIKSAVNSAMSGLKEENNELRKSFDEQNRLLKAMASQPQRAKSITGIEQLEKSVDIDGNPVRPPEEFTKSEKLDAAFELAKAGKIKDIVVSELEMTGSVADPQSRAEIERYLTQN